MFRKGSYIWIPDNYHAYLLAQVQESFKKGELGRVVDVDTEQLITLKAKDTKKIRAAKFDISNDSKDLAMLKWLDEPSILYSIRRRYYQDQIYTSIGPILVSVNPFKELPFYTNDVLMSCIRGTFASPHIFSMASKCYSQLLRTQKNQSCVVSGESGAGKTEATKLILQCLTERSASISPQSKAHLVFQQKILEINPLLEAFGNAKTVRNNNSSRFGKLTRLFISKKTGKILGVGIVDYLLEKSRIVTHAKGERNYHIFYQLLTDTLLVQEYGLLSPEKYQYLALNGDPKEVFCESLNDAEGWRVTLDAMEQLGIIGKEIKCIERVLIGLLCLGNIIFEARSDRDPANIVETQLIWLEKASTCLGLNKQNLTESLLKTEIKVRNDVTYKEHTKQQANDARDALAKSIYHAVFMNLIKSINERLNQSSSEPSLSINILDIFGFESFERNSFEQLCINYCNEKLQVHFIDNVFKAEEQAYLKEGIEVKKIDFVDASRVIDIFESRPNGIFYLLDEQNKLPTGNESKFLARLISISKGVVGLKTPRSSAVRKNELLANNFNIVHYAGEVSYNVSGFLEKNSDKLLVQLEEIVLSSQLDYLQDVFSAYCNMKKQGKTIGLKFKKQLTDLLQVLNSSDPHFIRTIKPNSDRVPDKFNSSAVLQQIHSAGLHFLHRYRLVTQSKVTSATSLVEVLKKENLLSKDACMIGKTRIFLKNRASESLETLREKRLYHLVMKIQSIVRGYFARKRVNDIKKTVFRLQEALEKNDANLLQAAITDIAKVHGAVVSNLLMEAKKALKRIEEIDNLLNQLITAVERRDANLISSLLNRLDGFKGHIVSQNSIVENAQKVLEELKHSNVMFNLSSEAVKAYLDQVLDNMLSSSGVNNKDINQLKSLVEALQSAGKEKSLQEAKILLDYARLQLEVQDFVSVARESKNPEDLGAAMDLIQQINLKTEDAEEVRRLQIKLTEKLQNEENSRSEQKPLNLLNLAASMIVGDVNQTTVKQKILMSNVPSRAEQDGRGGSKVYKDKAKKPFTNSRMSKVVPLSEMPEATKRHLFVPSAGSRLSMSIKQIMQDPTGLPSQYKEKVHELSNFYLLRSPSERENLCWSGFPISSSFTTLNQELSLLAMQLNRSILQYTGDQKFQYPSSAAQKVLQMGITYPSLCNELYIQILRNIQGNKKPTSEAKSWILLVLVTQLVPPTKELFPFVQYCIKPYTEFPLLIGNSARLCLAQINRAIKLGASDAIPDVDLITQYSTRPALLLDIKSCRRNVKGKLVHVLLPCYPDTEVDTILECACEVLGFNPNDYNKYGLFVKGERINLNARIRERLRRFYIHWDPAKLKHIDYFATLYKDKEEDLFEQLISKYGPEPSGMNTDALLAPENSLEDFFYPLPWWMYPGDAFMKLSFKGKEASFSIKRKLILSDTELTIELFEQTRELIACGELAITSYKNIIGLAAITFNLYNKGIVSSQDIILNKGLEYILPQVWLNEKPAKQILNAIYNACQKYVDNPKSLLSSFFSLCKKAEGYGVWFYPVTQVKSYSSRQGETITALDFIGVSHKGLHLFDSTRTETLQLFPFERISEYGADSDVVWFHFKTSKGREGPQAEFSTEFSWEVYAIIQAFLEATKAKKERPATSFHRYSVFMSKSFKKW